MYVYTYIDSCAHIYREQVEIDMTVMLERRVHFTES